VFEQRVLWGIFGLKRDQVIMSTFITMQSIIRMMKSRRMKWQGNVTCMGEKRHACRILVGKPERKRPLRIPRYRLDLSGSG
jgi:hypothetical protein